MKFHATYKFETKGENVQDAQERICFTRMVAGAKVTSNRLLQSIFQQPKINLLKTKIFNVNKILKFEIQTLFNYYTRYFSLNNIVMDVLKKISKKSINNNINILKNVIKISVYIV